MKRLAVPVALLAFLPTGCSGDGDGDCPAVAVPAVVLKAVDADTQAPLEAWSVTLACSNGTTQTLDIASGDADLFAYPKSGSTSSCTYTVQKPGYVDVSESFVTEFDSACRQPVTTLSRTAMLKKAP